MWNSLAVLNGIAFWGLWTAGIASAVAAVAGLAGGLAASRASDITSKAAEERIADANSRAAEATARAEDARLQAAKIAEGMAWRSLSGDQRQVLVSELKGANFKVWTSFVGHDPEAAQYRDQIDGALVEAGLKTQFFSGWAQAAGVAILGVDSEEKRRISDAFLKAGIPHRLEQPNRSWGQDCPCIIIGTKLERL